MSNLKILSRMLEQSPITRETCDILLCQDELSRAIVALTCYENGWDASTEENDPAEKARQFCDELSRKHPRIYSRKIHGHLDMAGLFQDWSLKMGIFAPHKNRR